MKKVLLIVAALIALIAFPVVYETIQCNTKSVATQVVPDIMRLKTKQTKPVTPKIEPKMVVVPKVEPKTVTVPKTKPKTVVVPKVEPKTVVVPKVEPKTVVVPKVEPKTVVVPKVEPKTVASKPVAQVSIVDFWLVPYPFANSRDIFAITFVVKNNASRAVKVKVVCHYVDKSLLGESMSQTIDAKSDAKLMIRGFRPCPSELGCRLNLSCSVVPVE
jgi:hypothetical protein